MKDPLPRIPFVTWQLPQDHLIFLSVHMREKRHRQRVGGKKETRRTVPQGERGREHYTPPVFISISHQIRSLADKGASWHITSSLWRKLTRAGDSEWQQWWRAGWRSFFWQSEREKGKTKVNLTYLQPRSTEPSEMKKRRRRKSGKRQRGEEALRIV